VAGDAPTISIGDLDVIVQTLVRPSEKLHYLVRWNVSEQWVNFYGDEMDLLAFYLETRFHIGTADIDPAFVLQMGGFEQHGRGAVVIAVNADQPTHPCNGIAVMVPRAASG
jgi:hypothetical protein